MKLVKKPKQEEEASYHSDFSGIEFVSQCGPDVELNIKCNYGSDYDGADLTFHLTDPELEMILDFIKNKLAPATKLNLREQIKSPDDNVGIILYLLDNAD